ncbi:MAG: hypothetical protein R2741_08190 [Methanolobus sp.]
MAEDIGTVINKGFSTWKKNLNICFPFIFEMITAIAFFVFGLFVFTLIFLAPVISEQNINPDNITPEELLGIFSEVLVENAILAIIAALILLMLYMLVQSFFAAGAIGMAKVASEKGNTTLGDMISAGRSNFFNLFLVNILVLLLAIAGLVFLVPGIISIGDINLFINNPDSEAQGAALLVLGMLVWALYILILSIVFFLVDYALVVENLDPMGAIGRGISVFRHNMFSVFLMWILVIGISMLFTVIGEAVSGVETLSQIWSFIDFILSTIVIQPLITVWLTRFYLTRIGQKLYSFEDYILD